MQLEPFNPVESADITGHVKSHFSIAFPMNSTTVILIRRQTLEGGNFGEEVSTPNIHYTLKMNINPLRNNPYTISKEGVVRDFTHSVITDVVNYPKTGIFVNTGLVANMPLVEIFPTDIVLFRDKKYELSDQFENTGFNDQDDIFQKFFMKILTDQ